MLTSSECHAAPRTDFASLPEQAIVYIASERCGLSRCISTNTIRKAAVAESYLVDDYRDRTVPEARLGAIYPFKASFEGGAVF